jgi:branched-chain amino acid transport system permease protein
MVISDRLLRRSQLNTRVSPIAVLCVIAAGALLPFALQFVTAQPNFYLELLITFFIYAVIAQCWNLVMAVAGVFSLLPVVLYAVGGYATSLLVLYMHGNPWLTIWAAPVAATIAALVVGVPILRLRGVYVALLTLAIQELLSNYIANGPAALGRTIGLTVPDIPYAGVFGTTGRSQFYYYLAGAVFLVTMVAVWWLLRSPLGLALRGIRDSAEYAVSRGVNLVQLKLFVFAFSAFFTGLAGGIYVHFESDISSSILTFDFLIALSAMIILGGWGTFWGPIVGTAIYVALDSWLLQPLGAGFSGITLGAIMVAVVVLTPRGIQPLIADAIWRRLGPWLDEGDEEDDDEEDEEDVGPTPGARIEEGM